MKKTTLALAALLCMASVQSFAVPLEFQKEDKGEQIRLADTVTMSNDYATTLQAIKDQLLKKGIDSAQLDRLKLGVMLTGSDGKTLQRIVTSTNWPSYASMVNAGTATLFGTTTDKWTDGFMPSTETPPAGR